MTGLFFNPWDILDIAFDETKLSSQSTNPAMAINDGQGTTRVPDRGFTLWIVSVVMVIVAGLFVIVRLASRLSMNKFGYDDYTIIAALVSFWPLYDSTRPKTRCLTDLDK